MIPTYTAPVQVTPKRSWEPPHFPDPQLLTDEEVQKLREARTEYAKELSAVQSEIRRCRERLRELEEIETRLANALWNCSRASSPVTRIPDDVLREIFLLCLPNRWEIELDPREAPVLLTHVCHRWRNLAIALIPSLWTALKVRDCGDLGLQLSIEWLERAKESPLQLQLDFKSFNRKFNNDSKLPFITRLIEPGASNNITSLSLILIPRDDIARVRPGLLPALQRLCLSVHVSYTPDECERYGPIEAFSDCRGLTSIAINCFFCGSGAHPHITLPFTQNLVHFIEYERPTSYRTFFTTQFPALRRLHLLSIILGDRDDMWLPSPNDADAVETSPMVMDAMKTLRIRMTASACSELGYPDFLSKFEFPNLERLMLSVYMMALSERNGWKELLLNKMRSFQSLTCLSLATTEYAKESLHAILESIPHVTTLEFDFPINSYNRLFETLTPADEGDHSILVPFLHTFVMHINQVDWMEDAFEPIQSTHLEQFISSRLKAHGEQDISKAARSRWLERIVMLAIVPRSISPRRAFVQAAQAFTPRGLEVELRLKKLDQWTAMIPEVSEWMEVMDPYY